MKNKKEKYILMIVVAMLVMISAHGQVQAKAKYTVTPKKLVKEAKKNHKSYTNKYVQHYVGLNDYLDKLAKAGGGTLTIKKGKYKISNSLYVPSNVKIILNDGVVFEKIMKTGKSDLKPAGSMWQLCPHEKSKKKNSIGKYKGTKNVQFVAKGKVIFDMKNVRGLAIVVAHCKNIEISGITFKGMNGDHYIEANSSKNVKIHDNDFTKAKSSTLAQYRVKEAINIDLADKTTGGLPLQWVKQDKTPCDGIKIYNNVFDGTNRGVGTHKYSQDKKGNNIYHKNIVIENNIFKNHYDNGVFVLNWKDAVIKNNTFYNIGNSQKKVYSSGSHAISGGGIDGISITGNTFEKIKRNAVCFIVQRNVGGGSQYKNVTVKITKEQTEAMVNNTVKDCGDDMNSNYAGYDILYFINDSTRSRTNGVGIDLNRKKVYYGIPKNKEESL